MSSRLRANCLNFWEVLAQSIAMIGPTITPVLIVPLMFAQAGNAGWLAYLFGAVMLGAVALNINVFARRSATAGSLYTFALRAFGPRGASFIGWCQLWAYVFVAVAGLCAFAIFFPKLAALAHLSVPQPLAAAICGGIAWLLTYRDVRVAAIALLTFEGISIALIVGLVALVFAHHGGDWIDVRQLELRGATPTGLALGAVLAIFSMLGFESATSLGEEAHAPLQTIPRAVMASVLVAGIFFIVVTYAEVLGTRGLTPSLERLTTPLDNLADAVGAPYMKIPIDVGALLCCVSIATAAISGAARALLMMGRTGLMPAAFGRTHPEHETPVAALATVAGIVTLVAVGALAAGRAPIDAFADTATLCSYAFVVVYGAVAIGASVYLRRLGELRGRNLAVSAIAVAFLFVPAIGSVYPAPPWPADLYPLAFVAYAVVGVALLWRRPQTAPLATADPSPSPRPTTST